MSSLSEGPYGQRMSGRARSVVGVPGRGRAGSGRPVALAAGVPEHGTVVSAVIDAREGRQPAAGPGLERAPPQHVAFHLVYAQGDLALIRALLDEHVHVVRAGPGGQ